MIKNCEHIKVNGEPCGSPAMNGSNWCYFHAGVNDLNNIPGNPNYLPPALEDPLSVQLFIMQVTKAQICGSITPYQATGLLALARTAIQNLRLQKNYK